MQMYCIHSSALKGANIEPSPVRSLCGRERAAQPDACIASCTLVIIFTWTVHIPAGAKYEALWRPALVQPECIIKQQNVRWAQRWNFTGSAHVKIRYWSHFSLSFLPSDEREFSPPQSKAQPATIGPIRKLLSTWNTVEECVINYRKDAAFRCSSRTAVVAEFIYWS